IVLASNAAGDGGTNRWGSAFLPAIYQGTLVPTTETDAAKQVQNLTNSKLSSADQRRQLDLLQRLNRMQLEEAGRAPELEATIQSMEVAFRMQTEALMSLTSARNPSPPATSAAPPNSAERA